MIPLYGFLQGDTLGLLILADPNETLMQVREKLKNAASIRVKPRPNGKLIYKDSEMDLKLKLSFSGIQALDRIDLIW